MLVRMSSTALSGASHSALTVHPTVTICQVESGVACSRCTGYRPIVDAFRPFASVPASAYTQDSLGSGQDGSKQENGHAQDVQVRPFPAWCCAGCLGHTRAVLYHVVMMALLWLPELHMLNRVIPHGRPLRPHGQQVCPASGLPCNCGAAAKQGASQGHDGTNGSTHANGSSNGHKVVPAREPLFPGELKRLQAQELCLPGRCTWLRWGAFPLVPTPCQARVLGSDCQASHAQLGRCLQCRH